MTPAGLSIGEVAERTGLSVHTLRYYEREGLLAAPVRRASNGHRVYSEHDVEWLTVCTNLRATGMPLTAIRRYAGVVREGNGDAEGRLAILRDHQQSLSDEIAALAERLELIGRKVRVFEDGLDGERAERECTPPPRPGAQPRSARSSSSSRS